MSILELIKDNKVTFDSYRAGFFYYNIEVGHVEYNQGVITRTSPVIAQFTVPVEDIGNATLLKEDKAINFMRWIRKAVEENTLINKNEQPKKDSKIPEN